MARLRTIKPGFFHNEELCDLDPLARLLFAGLWTIADREGRLEDRPRRIKVECLPYDECDVGALLSDLAAAGFIVRYSVEGGLYIAIPAFLRHQNPHVREAPAIFPPPPSPAGTVPAPGEHQACTRRAPGEARDETGSSCPRSCLVTGHGSCPGEEQAPLSSADAAEAACAATAEPSPPAVTVAVDDGFDAFWAAYPRREDRKRSHSAWRRLTKAERALAAGVAEIMTALVTSGHKERRYVPIASSFLNGKRWEDWREGVPAGWQAPGHDVAATQAANLAAAVAAAEREEDSR